MKHRLSDSRLAQTVRRSRKGVQRLIRDTHDHYACWLPLRIGALPALLLRLFYRGISLSPKQTAVFRALPPDAIRVLVTKYESRFEGLFYYTRYRDTGHPAPTLFFDQRVWLWQPLSRVFRIALAHADSLLTRWSFPDPYASGFYRRELLAGSNALIALTGQREFRRRFVKQKTDPIKHLIELQQTTERPVVLIPHIMMFSKRPDKTAPRVMSYLLGPEKRPGLLRRIWTLFKKPGQIFVEVSEPLNLRDFLAKPACANRDVHYRSLMVRRNLLDQINRHRQAIVGPALKSRLELKQNLLTSPRFGRFMEEMAQSQNLPIQKVHQRADAYFEEIAANYNPTMIKIFDVLLTWIIRNMFDGVLLDQKGLDRVKRMAARGPVVLLPCHKSHIDYLMLSYVMYHNAMPCPHIVAGKNLSFWPLGPVFRNAGAFFVRRTFKGHPIYAGVFAAYVEQLLRGGFNIEVFIEGGRSRTGKLLSPKTGFLSMLLEAYQRGACDTLTLAPVFIGYDNVPEEKAYLHELEGGKKEPENLQQVIKARKFLKKRFGKIYIEFAQPLFLGDLLADQGLDLEQAGKPEREAFCRYIGHRTINAINRVAVITPHAVMAAALLNCPKERFRYAHVAHIADTYCRYLQFCGAKLADTLQVDPARPLKQAFEAYLQRKFVEKASKDSEPDDPDCRFLISDAKRPSLEYYKNNGIAPFVPAAFTAIVLLSLDAFQFSSTNLHTGYRFLQHLFKYEFSYDLEKQAEYHVRKSVKSFIDDAVLMPHPTLPDTYNITSAGLRKLRLYAGFCRSYLEAYSVVIDYLESHSPEGQSPSEHLKKIEARSNRMLKSGDISLTESRSRVAFGNALAFFNARDIFGREDNDKLAPYAAQVQQYLSCFH